MTPLLLLCALLSDPVVPAKGLGGLGGLGPPGGLQVTVDPKAAACENDLFSALNAHRARNTKPPLTMDERLRLFARRQATLAANGDPAAQHAEETLKSQNLAPLGHRLQFSFGANGAKVLAELQQKPDTASALLDDFQRVGIGAFWVPETEPYCQVTLLLVEDPDPMIGKPGLSPAQTDPVMEAAHDAIRACYDKALLKNPNLRGDATMLIVIGANGRPERVSFTKGLGALDTESCLMNVVRGLTFPLPYKGKPVTLYHPMAFTPPQGNRKLGKLTVHQISQGFAPLADGFKACLDARLKIRPTLVGTITLAGVINGHGDVAEARILEDEIADPELAGCALALARTAHFAAPTFGGEVDFTYPLRFGL